MKKKIKIGDHEITIGPKVVTIDQSGEHTINPTTDMVIITESMDRETYLRFPIFLSIGQGAYEGQKLTFVVKAYDDAITTHITINGVNERFIDGQTIEIVYNGNAWNYVNISDAIVQINRNWISTGKLYNSKPIYKATHAGAMSEDTTVSLANYRLYYVNVSGIPDNFGLVNAEGRITINSSSIVAPTKVVTLPQTKYAGYSESGNTREPIYTTAWFDIGTKKISVLFPKVWLATTVTCNCQVYFALL